jgi:HK97 family phage major capsid protein
VNELQKLKEQRATVLAAAKEIITRAQARPEAERDLTAEENHKVDEAYAEFDRLGTKIDTLERMSRLQRAEEQLAEGVRRTAPARPAVPEAEAPTADVGEGLRAWFLRSRGRLSEGQRENAQRCGIDLNSPELTVRFNPAGEVSLLNGEGDSFRRDLITTSGTSGLTSWREFYAGYEKYEKFYGRARDMVTVVQTASGVAMPVPTFDDTSNTGQWLSEGTTVAQTDPTVGSVTIGAFKASSDEIPISIELLQDGQVSMNAILPMLLGERIGRLKNKGIVNGAGTTEPRGILLDAANSAIVLAGTNAAPTYSWDDWLDLKSTVDPVYRAAPADKRGFLMHDTVLRKLRKLKDSQNRYLADPFNPGPGTLDGDPIFVNNDVPATGISAKVGAYGDYSRYMWREVMEVTFYRLDQIRIRDGKIVFLAFARCDGRLLNTSAVKYLKNPAS